MYINGIKFTNFAKIEEKNLIISDTEINLNGMVENLKIARGNDLKFNRKKNLK